MNKIKTKKDFKTVSVSVYDYVKDATAAMRYCGGQIEDIEQEIDNTREAFARLVQTLANKGMLNNKEICYISNGSDYEFKD